MTIDIEDQELQHERVRLVHAEWSEMLRAIEACARRLEQLDASNQAEALRVDMYYLAQRAERHLRQVIHGRAPES